MRENKQRKFIGRHSFALHMRWTFMEDVALLRPWHSTSPHYKYNLLDRLNKAACSKQHFPVAKNSRDGRPQNNRVEPNPWLLGSCQCRAL